MSHCNDCGCAHHECECEERAEAQRREHEKLDILSNLLDDMEKSLGFDEVCTIFDLLLNRIGGRFTVDECVYFTTKLWRGISCEPDKDTKEVVAWYYKEDKSEADLARVTAFIDTGINVTHQFGECEE